MHTKMIVQELKKRSIPDERILHYNFDSMQHEDIKTAKLLFEEVKARLVSGEKTYLFLDEIQEVKSWEKAINSFMTDFNVDIYVTGPNSHMMSSEISTYLTGGYITFRIFPLSFSEYLTFRKEYGPDGTYDNLSKFTWDQKGEYTHGELAHNLYSELARYLRLGGFPAVHLQSYTPDEAYPIIRDIRHCRQLS